MRSGAPLKKGENTDGTEILGLTWIGFNFPFQLFNINFLSSASCTIHPSKNSDSNALASMQVWGGGHFCEPAWA